MLSLLKAVLAPLLSAFTLIAAASAEQPPEIEVAAPPGLSDWATYQGSHTHAGFVRIKVNPRAISKVWGYTHDSQITRVAADKDRVYFSAYAGTGLRGAEICAVDGRSGELKWTYDLGETAYVGDPAIADGLVVVSSMVVSSDTNPITVLNAASGAFVRQMTFAAQWSNFLAPTIRDGEVYTASGYFGNVVYSHELGTGDLLWNGYGSGYYAYNGETPAVGAECVYFYTGESLDCFSRVNGTRTWSIPDPEYQVGGYTYDGAPIILFDGSVLGYSGTTGGGGYFEAYYRDPRPLVRYIPGSRSIAWRSAQSYVTTPAVRGDLIFVGGNNPSRLDALDVRTGEVVWSWTPPAGQTPHGNTIAANNVVFFSTERKVYALRISDRAVVWSRNTPGVLAISPRGLLLISEAADYGSRESFESNGRLSAFRLQ